MPKYIFKKTSNLSDVEINQIIDLTFEVFDKQMTHEQFIKLFKDNEFGYSYHGLIVNDIDVIVGVYSSIPYRYMYYGSRLIFCLSVYTMIHEQYRGGRGLKIIANLVYDEMKMDNVCFVFGFPNENVYEYRKKILSWVDIGNLSYYLLPRDISKIKPKLSFVSPLVSILSKIISAIPCFSRQNIELAIQKVNDVDFIRHRYDNSYDFMELGDNGEYAVYKTYLEGDVRALYVIDVFPLSKKMLNVAANRIFNSDEIEFDIMIYVGSLDFTPVNIIKLPKKYEPKQIMMSGKILLPDVVDERIFDIGNWNVNISNFDVR